MKATVTKEEFVDTCASIILTAIVNGNLKQAVTDIVDKSIVWNNTQKVSEDSAPVLLNETLVTDKVAALEKAQDEQAKTGVRPAPLNNTVTSSVQQMHEGKIPAPVGNTTSTGWSNPFKGTSWGV